MQPQTGMRPETAAALLALNRQFYDQFGGDFAATRRSHPPGYDRILPYLSRATNVLDLGCGSGRLLAYLAQRAWSGQYTGLDGSARLLEEAAAVPLGPSRIQRTLIHADLFDAGWPDRVQRSAPFDAIVSLAVLHHIPGAANRAAFLRRCASLLPPGKPLILTTWQFMSSERLRKRLVPWERANISEAELEPGDYLVGWGEGSPGARYCALIDEAALIDMAAGVGFDAVETFTSDGHEGRLNLYAILERRP
jgi:alkylated DNA repair protein alkB family protein 8